MSFVSSLPDGRSVIAVYVQPRASRTGLTGIHDQALKLAITSPPVDNEANKKIVSFFAALFKVSRQEVLLYKGQRSRRKQVIICGLTEETVRARIMAEICQRSEP
jgi:uncharacterized protein (TIGR00251 family)